MTATDTPLRVGIVGAGWMGQTHGIGWSENTARGRIAAVADVSEARGRALSERFTAGAARVFTDLDTMLRGGEIDAVDICLPHHLHRDAIVAAAQAGKHVLCEKPLCLSFQEAREIRDAVEHAGVTFMAAHNNLFAPGLVEARRLLDAGTLGRLYFVRSFEGGRNTNMKTRQPPAALAEGASSWSWRVDPQKAGGGEVLDTGWHAAYRLLALAGARPVEVSATVADFYINEPGLEDTAAILARFENGAIGFLLTTWAFPNVPGAPQFQVAGEHGVLGGAATKLTVALHGQQPEEKSFPQTHTFAREIEHFIAVVRGGVEGKATWRHAARTLQFVLGAYKAAAEKRTVALPEDPTTL